MNRRYPRYPDDADYQTNAPSYYEDLARKQKLIEMLAKKIWEYEEKLDITLDDIESRVQERFSEWDGRIESFPDDVESLLQDWLSDGTLDHIINETIFNMKADQVDLDKTNAVLARSVKFFDHVEHMKNSDLTIKSVVDLKGFYSAGDNGGHRRVISENDDGTGIQLNNGLWANIVYESELHAKWFGAVLDGVADDTGPIQKLFDNFGKANLIVDKGIYNINETLTLKGIWRNWEGNNAYRTIRFDRATARWTGIDDKCAINVINHHTSIIEGLALERNSNAYINFSAIWYSEIKDFDIPQLTWNKNINNYKNNMETTSSYTNVFSNGYTNKPFEIYGAIAGGLINSVTFRSINFDGKSKNNYNIEFYGKGGFHLIRFVDCDLSYATISNLLINEEQPTMAINFDGCYFDTAIPLVFGHDYKNAKIIMENQRESSWSINQKYLMTTKNFLNNVRLGTEGIEADNLPYVNTNVIINGDIANTEINNSWLYTYPGTLAEITSNDNTIHGNSVRMTLSDDSQGARFKSCSVPFTGKYSVLIRLKKISGSGIVQITHGENYPKFDISSLNDGEEIVLTYQRESLLEQGKETPVDLTVWKLKSDKLILEILEVVLMPGLIPTMFVPTHPKATTAQKNLFRRTTTSGRPKNVDTGYTMIDTTLNKIIWWNGTDWIDAMGDVV